MPATTVLKEVPVMGAGSVAEISFDGGTAYAEVPEIESIPQVGEDGSFIEINDIRFKTKRYIAGVKTPPQWEMLFRDVGNDSVQDQIIAAADAGQSVKMRITYESGRIASFDLVLSGHYQGQVEFEGALMHAVKGQISGSVSWTKVAAGV